MPVLKRHPFAVALALLILICGCIDKDFWKMEGSPPRESFVGLYRGNVVWGYYTHPDSSTQPAFNLRDVNRPVEFHFPTLGGKLEWGANFSIESMFEAVVPLWIPMLAIAAWMALFEIIRHKKRTASREDRGS